MGQAGVRYLLQVGAWKGESGKLFRLDPWAGYSECDWGRVVSLVKNTFAFIKHLQQKLIYLFPNAFSRVKLYLKITYNWKKNLLLLQKTHILLSAIAWCLSTTCNSCFWRSDALFWLFVKKILLISHLHSLLLYQCLHQILQVKRRYVWFK